LISNQMTHKPMSAKICRIKSISLSLLAFLFFAHPESSNAQQVPPIFNYQGRVSVSGTNFNGTGLFKFELINTDGSTVYWSNDGSVSGTVSVVTAPQAAVSLPVTNGLYSLLLGDTNVANMTAIPASAFTNGDARLRIWFDDGVHATELLTPDQRIGSVGYAFVSGSAAVAATVPAGAISSSQLAAGSVDITKFAPRATGTSVGVGGVAISAPLTGFSTGTTGQNIPIPSTSITITTTGRPVLVFLSATAGGSTQSYVAVKGDGTTFPFIETLSVLFYRDNNGVVSSSNLVSENSAPGGTNTHTGVSVPPGSFQFLDMPPAGTHTYTLGVNLNGLNSPNPVVGMENLCLVAIEL
jgi:hypothetical protein